MNETGVEVQEGPKIETNFSPKFFSETWPKLGGVEVADSVIAASSPKERCTILWNSLTPSLELLGRQFNLPFTKTLGESDGDFFRKINEALHCDDEHIDNNQQKMSIWPSVAKETGLINCTLGSQIEGYVLEKAGYGVEFGMPGPMSHAVIIAEDEAGEKFYLDSANGIIEKISGVKVIGGVKTYLIETNDPRIPYRLIPVCALAESVATTIWNLASLREDAKTNSEFVKYAEGFGVQEGMAYGDWALYNLLPRWSNVAQHPEWLKEKQESSERIDRNR